MSDTTNQMSLLDAIGFSAPEDKKTKKNNAEDTPAKTPAKKRKAARKAEVNKASVDVSSEMAEAAGIPPVDAPSQDAPAASPSIATATTSEPEEEANHNGAALSIPDGGNLPLDKYLCFALYSANHAMHGVYKALLKEVGLTYPQFLAMTVLWDKNNVPVGAITQKLQLDTNTLTPLLKRLEAMGLLTRTRSTKDERQVILKLTRKGRALQKKTEHFGNCVFSSTGMSLNEIVDLQDKIMKLRDNLRTADVT